MIQLKPEPPEEVELEELRGAIDKASEVWTGYYKDEVACVIGLMGQTILSNRAYLWLYHTPIVAEHKFLFVRYSQMWVKQALQNYEELWGYALTENTLGIRWLRWLGAEFDYPGDRQVRFTIRAK